MHPKSGTYSLKEPTGSAQTPTSRRSYND